MKKEFESYSDAWREATKMMYRMEYEGVENLTLVTRLSGRKIELFKLFEEDALISDKRNNLLATFKYYNAN